MKRAPAAAAALLVALPLAACASPAPVSDLVAAGCPADIRIDTDDLPNVDWGFLYSLLDRDAVRTTFIGREVTAPLLVDGEDTGLTLTILSGDPRDGTGGEVALHEDESILLAAVDTDQALLDLVQYPSVGLLAPTARDTRLVFWGATAYPGVTTIEGLGDTLSPDGMTLVPISGRPGDPWSDVMWGRGTLGEGQVTADSGDPVAQFLAGNGTEAYVGDLLTDPFRLALPELSAPDEPPSIRRQLVDDAGYTRTTLLSARPQAVVRYADCLGVLIPVLQQALVDYQADPDATDDLMVDVAATFGHPEIDAALIGAAHEAAESERIFKFGRNQPTGHIDVGDIRDLLAAIESAWADLEYDQPDEFAVEKIATNEFIDRSIGT